MNALDGKEPNDSEMMILRVIMLIIAVVTLLKDAAQVKNRYMPTDMLLNFRENDTKDFCKLLYSWKNMRKNNIGLECVLFNLLSTVHPDNEGRRRLSWVRGKCC